VALKIIYQKPKPFNQISSTSDETVFGKLGLALNLLQTWKFRMERRVSILLNGAEFLLTLKDKEDVT
jgi:hypothetical protein